MVSLDWSGVLKQGTKSRQAQLTAGCELVKRTDHSLPLHTRRQHENRIQILLKTFTNFHILPTNLLTSRTCECAGDCVEYCMFIGLNNGILRFSHVLQSHYHSFQISLRSYFDMQYLPPASVPKPTPSLQPRGQPCGRLREKRSKHAVSCRTNDEAKCSSQLLR